MLELIRKKGRGKVKIEEEEIPQEVKKRKVTGGSHGVSWGQLSDKF